MVKSTDNLFASYSKTKRTIIICLLIFFFKPATWLFALHENQNREDDSTIYKLSTSQGESLLSSRLESDDEEDCHFFSIRPHRPNYILPVTYSEFPNSKSFQDALGTDDERDDIEVKFQLSLKFAVYEDIVGETGDIWLAYTQQTFWQLYNQRNSAPFGETNFEPEIGITFDNDYKILGLTNSLINLGFTHQSNGRSEPLSRSWNRIYASFVFNSDDLTLILKPWYWLPEDDSSDSDPDIKDYVGYGEISTFYINEKHVIGLIIRNNFSTDDNRGSVQFDWTYPLTRALKGYVQFFNGYGESMIDATHSHNRIGIGIMLTDWL
jgi:phospholipase A1